MESGSKHPEHSHWFEHFSLSFCILHLSLLPSPPRPLLHFLRRFLLHASDSGAHEETPLPLHNADAPSVGRMKLLRHVSEAGCVSLGLMMARRPAHCPSAYAHSCVCVSLCKCARACACACVRARGWQGSSCWLKATPLPTRLLFLLLLPRPHRAPCEKRQRGTWTTVRSAQMRTQDPCHLNLPA